MSKSSPSQTIRPDRSERPITALSFKTGVDVPERFAKSKTVGAHFGITPRAYSSGELDYHGRISKCGDEMVRSALYEAANSLVVRVKAWSAPKAGAARLARRVGGKKARVALARKLAVILHRIWLEGTSFKWTKEAAA